MTHLSHTRPGSSSSLPGGATGRRGPRCPQRVILAGLSWIEGGALQHDDEMVRIARTVMCAARAKSTHEGRATC